VFHIEQPLVFDVFLNVKALFFLKLRLSSTDIKTMRPERAGAGLSV
jgi:hypothetical protein